MNSVNVMGLSFTTTFAIGILLLIAYIYVILYNYLYKKYRSKFEKSENIFNVKSPKETFISMIDVILFVSLFRLRIVPIKT